MSDPLVPDTSTPVPATAFSGGSSSAIVIGDKTFGSPFPSGSQGFMYAVVDLSTLDVVAQAAPVSNTTVPPEIQPYANKEGYFLFFVAVQTSTASLPQGDLYNFLKNTGSGASLANLEQIIGQLGTGFLSTYSYILAGTLDGGDLPGFEAMSLDNSSILPMQFTPFTDPDGNTRYAPTRATTP